MATYRYTNTSTDGLSLKLNERPIYGSSRLGSFRKQEELRALPTFSPQAANPIQQVDLNYELTDHLGNVTAVVTGRLLDGNGGGTPKQAELVSAQGYDAFGSLLPGRNYSSDSYRFGFNSQEQDNEIYNAPGTSYTAEFWQYDSRVGRRWNLDPVDKPWQTRYHAFSNSPISKIDPNGANDTDYKLKKNGEIEQIGPVNDEPDRLFSSNDDGSVNMDNHVTINDKNILPQLASIKPSDKGNTGLISLSQSPSKNDMYSLFKFTADNSTSEWGINYSKNGNSDTYWLGTFFDPDQSPSYATMGVALSNVVAHMHSHPNPGVGDLESMGWWNDGKTAAGDWANARKRQRVNGGEAPFYDAVYFPDSGKLYNIQYNKPAYIRNIKGDYNRFFYGAF